MKLLFLLIFPPDCIKINNLTDWGEGRLHLGPPEIKSVSSSHKLRVVIMKDGISDHYRPQTKFAKVMFLQVSVCPHGGGQCVVVPGGYVVAPGGACVVAWGGMRGCSGGHAWLLLVGVHGCSGGACMVGPAGGGHVWLLGGHAWLLWGGAWLLPGGHAWLLLGGHAWDTTRYGDMINERAVCILLECILVLQNTLKSKY